MALTAAEMNEEATAVAEGIAALIEAGTDKGASISARMRVLLTRGMGLFGDIDAGLDDDANRVRFAMKVGAKVADQLADRLLPLTEESDGE